MVAYSALYSGRALIAPLFQVRVSCISATFDRQACCMRVGHSAAEEHVEEGGGGRKGGYCEAGGARERSEAADRCLGFRRCPAQQTGHLNSTGIFIFLLYVLSCVS